MPAAWLQPGVPFMAPDRPVATLIGRTAELEQAAGVSSVGKTTLAIEVASSGHCNCWPFY